MILKFVLLTEQASLHVDPLKIYNKKVESTKVLGTLNIVLAISD